MVLATGVWLCGYHPRLIGDHPVLALATGSRAYRKAGYLTMVIAGYIPANSQLAAAIATIVKSLSIGK